MDFSQNFNVFYVIIIILVCCNGYVVVVGDGQVMFGYMVMKGNVCKVCCLGCEGQVLVGFVGVVVDVFILFELFEVKLEKYGQLQCVVVELVKDWCIECCFGKLEVLFVVVDKDILLIISGIGDVIELEDGIIVIGLGGFYVLLVVCVLLVYIELDVCIIVIELINIVGDICIYINCNVVVEEL